MTNIIFGVPIFLIVIMLISVIVVGVGDRGRADQLGCRNMTLQECRCVKAGGIYITGGLFSGPQCVFPPKN